MGGSLGSGAQRVNSFAAISLKRAGAESPEPAQWTLPEVAGRLVEVSGSAATASLTFALSLVLQAQCLGELAGWVTPDEAFFYPPDAAQTGVDLEALVIVRVRDFHSLPRAGEKLLRSGAFGLIVLDVGAADIPLPLQSRLASLARQHHTALICLTEKENNKLSLGSLISLRVHSQRRPIFQRRFACDLKILKDKRRGPTWSYTEVCCGPAGLY